MLGEFLARQKRYTDALPMLQQGLAIKEATFGSDDPHNAMSLFYLGIVHLGLKQYEPAEPEFQRAIAGWEKVGQPVDEKISSGD